MQLTAAKVIVKAVARSGTSSRDIATRDVASFSAFVSASARARRLMSSKDRG
jgi:hypothetical protein